MWGWGRGIPPPRAAYPRRRLPAGPGSVPASDLVVGGSSGERSGGRPGPLPARVCGGSASGASARPSATRTPLPAHGGRVAPVSRGGQAAGWPDIARTEVFTLHEDGAVGRRAACRAAVVSVSRWSSTSSVSLKPAFVPFDGYPNGGRELLVVPKWDDGTAPRSHGRQVHEPCGDRCTYCGLDSARSSAISSFRGSVAAP